MACDICDAKGTSLNDLLPGFQTDEIKSICPKCEKTVNNQVWKIRRMQDGIMKTLVKQYMENRRKEKK